jgi:hypothetical protein
MASHCAGVPSRKIFFFRVNYKLFIKDCKCGRIKILHPGRRMKKATENENVC